MAPPSSLDYFDLLREAKRIDPASCRGEVRIALLADCATQHIVPLLKALFYRKGLLCEVYEAPYDSVAQEARAADAPLYAFRPDLVVILNSVSSLRRDYLGFEGPAAAFAERSASRIADVWRAIEARTSAPIFQSNFAVPYDRIFGDYELKADASFPAAVVTLNRLLAEAARGDARIFINDLESVSSYLGRQRWFDEKLWFLCKSLCAFECLPHVARNVVSTAAALRGAGVKCVVVDLDNTLWGGVIGDDGLEGIRLGELGDGEAYQAFQHYLLELKRRGLILAVCSRNDPDTARLPFQKHPDMVIKESDLALFVANWGNKAENVKAIQENLGIGMDSILFLDDDPFERNLVRGAHPEAIVPELPPDPADYVKSLCELNLFEAVTYSEEDRRRADFYRDQARRKVLQASFANIEDYLRSLRMRATVARFDPFHLPRIVQLLARSNQFNLTTKRYGAAECESFMNDRSGCFPFYIALKDEQGDSGLIAAVVARIDGDALDVDAWVMSCRVLLRGVEELTMNSLFDFARGNGLKRVRGRYLPTPKNGLVKDLYPRFGFQKVSESADGSTEWSLDASGYEKRRVLIAVNEGARDIS